MEQYGSSTYARVKSAGYSFIKSNFLQNFSFLQSVHTFEVVVQIACTSCSILNAKPGRNPFISFEIPISPSCELKCEVKFREGGKQMAFMPRESGLFKAPWKPKENKAEKEDFVGRRDHPQETEGKGPPRLFIQIQSEVSLRVHLLVFFD